MRFEEHVGKLHHPLDLARRHRRCAVCGGAAFSWVLTIDGRSICTVCYQDVHQRLTVCESEIGGDLPWPNGISDARVTVK
jgi:hypothetical protein